MNKYRISFLAGSGALTGVTDTTLAATPKKAVFNLVYRLAQKHGIKNPLFFASNLLGSGTYQCELVSMHHSELPDSASGIEFSDTLSYNQRAAETNKMVERIQQVMDTQYPVNPDAEELDG